MKIRFTLFLSFCSVLLVTAQPVLQSENMAGPGTQYTMRGTILGNSLFSNLTGENQQWVFDDESNELGYRTEIFDPLDFAPGVAVPCSLIISNIYESPFGNDTSLTYVNVDPDGYYLLGYGTISELLVTEFTPPRLIYPFPLSYGDQYNSSNRFVYQDVWGSAGTDSIRSIVNENTTVSVSASGSLNINGNTFTVLLLNLVTESIDSSFFYQNGEWDFTDSFSQTYFSRQWLDVSSGIVVLEESEEEGFKGSVDYRYTYFFEGNIVPTKAVPAESSTRLQVYPNPSSGLTQLHANEAISHIRVFAADGRMAMQHTPSHSTDVAIDLSPLPAGLYLIDIQLADGSRTMQKVLKQ